ncbi:AAA domain-containing protein [Dactylosporangium sp. NPDC051484]|uniref:AAA domain-containing protein n=1 Tax=Dactylosporangium sp. NPDC051484 TaxID=3154942 RepID=UPI00344BA6D4
MMVTVAYRVHSAAVCLAGTCGGGEVAGPITGADPEVLRLTRGLVRLLHERTDESRPKPDEATGDLLWLAELRDILGPAGSEVLLELPKPSFISAPPPPAVLEGRLDPVVALDSRGAAPRLLPEDHPAEVRAAFERWQSEQRAWARADLRAERLQQVYGRLEQMAAEAARGRGGELVLGLGLVTVVRGGKIAVRRHILSITLVTHRDSAGGLRVGIAEGACVRLDDRALRQQPDGTFVGRSDDAALIGVHPLADGLKTWLAGYVRDSWRAPVRADPAQWIAPDPSTLDLPSLVLAPAIFVRRRLSGAKAAFYRRIAQSLETPDSVVPLGLAQLVVPIEPADRQRWLETGGAPPISADPLFPRRTNAEQRDVLRALRDDSVVVVQGPPGTGKTHTIANLLSALLADGQRVLVTSQNGAALSVIRDQLPKQVQRLCVQMSTDRADKELERSIRALSELGTTRSTDRLEHDIGELGRRRDHLVRARDAAVAALRAGREQEHSVHHAMPEPYRGTLRDLAVAISERRERFGWIGDLPVGAPNTTPLVPNESAELLRLLRGRTDERAVRGGQQLPAVDLVPAVEIVTDAFERLAAHEALAGGSLDADTMTSFTELEGPALADLHGRVDVAFAALAGCGLGEVLDGWPADDWRRTAAEALLAHRDAGIWTGLFATVDGVAALRDELHAGARSVSFDPGLTTGAATQLLGQALRLREYLTRGGRIRRWRPARAQVDAAELLQTCTIGGAAPRTAADLSAVVATLRCEIAVSDALAEWAAAGVRTRRGSLNMRLAQLEQLAVGVDALRVLLTARDAAQQVVLRAGLRYVVNSAERWDALVRIVRNVEVVRAAQRARRTLRATCDALRTLNLVPAAAPEVTELIEAIEAGDARRYRAAADELMRARRLQAEHRREAELLGRLQEAHRELAAMMSATAADADWDDRIAALDDAWAWACAVRYYATVRSSDAPDADAERVDELDDALREVTAELAGARGLRHYLGRLGEEQRQALQDYRIARDALGLGAGRYSDRHAADAADAMRAARAAVPAWVMPLGAVAEHVEAEPDGFDVVIVDEASQVGVDWLLLLWLAPRLVIVGDEKQCTPGDGPKAKQDELDAIDHHLQGMPSFRCGGFIPGRSLYELMSARVPRVIRLTEHFRSMPEIIGWSSEQFYDGNLMPLRQFGADRLEPLVLMPVRGEMEGTGDDAVNRAEVVAIMDQVEKITTDPAYQSRTIGVIALHSPAQVAALNAELQRRITARDIERLRIRVGDPRSFQGDQRSVVLLSMVYSAADRESFTARRDRQRYNVAVSRAEDQLWLFSSVPPHASASTKDMRIALLKHFRDDHRPLEPDPGLDDLPAGRYRPPFRSQFHQDVFGALRQRRYRVLPWFAVRDGHIDLVVVGDRGRLAVVCDGPRPLTTPESLAADVDREVELRRCGWTFVRLRESDYRFDATAALEPLWAQLRTRGIEPRDAPTHESAATRRSSATK